MPKSTTPMIEQYWHKGGLCGVISRAALRTLQFVFAIVIAGLYGVDLAHTTAINARAPSQWVYAEFVAAVTALTCIVHCFVTVTHVAWSVWDFMLFVLWLAQVGTFGSIYISNNVLDEYKKETSSIPRMRAAVWISLASMLLWFATTVLGIAWCCRTRKVTRRTDQVDAGKEQMLQRESDVESGSICGETKNMVAIPAAIVDEKIVKENIDNKGIPDTTQLDSDVAPPPYS
ncbi:hypothetical protein ANOM_002511 [Aspergillus nomiae NRRL 13137]|uniref:MARVEL domain-containing protein n=1 Tax=Aspergillus nomiae NRRL (strain ATCC 15546 / NRRL 13137 / CBS 260.88 / M93) TaxID=1509407 RepID=A0A0L1J930_ASPN3|nr:uncharacterized protein ANOM_002511 [Aspergillus nomiae NRRL 13137]KNG88311.1 hypothetical protein ANOM_002511 [Aspergillus nomiae NRRL 13137]